MITLGVAIAAAVAEIAGCYAFWVYVRQGQSPLWLGAGIVSLASFAFLLTRFDAAFAGRAFAGYGGIYIIASLFWLWLIEDQRPDLWDLAGAGLCLLGAMLIQFAPRPFP